MNSKQESGRGRKVLYALLVIGLTGTCCCTTGLGTFWYFDQSHVADAHDCDDGDQYACRRMGSYYEHGIGVDQDYALARDYYGRAHEMPVWPAVTEASAEDLARLYEDGLGGPVDLDRALELYEEACRSDGDDTSLGCSGSRRLRASMVGTPANERQTQDPRDAQIAAWGWALGQRFLSEVQAGEAGAAFPATRRDSQAFGTIRSVQVRVNYGPSDLSTVGPRGPNSPYTASFAFIITGESEVRYLGSAPVRITDRNIENHALLPADAPAIIATIDARLREAVLQNECRLPLVDRDYYQRGGLCWACPSTYETPGARVALLASTCGEARTKLASGYLMGAQLSISIYGDEGRWLLDVLWVRSPTSLEFTDLATYGQSPRYPGSAEDPDRAAR